MNNSSRARVARLVLVAVIGDLDPAHQFHDEIRPASIRRARVQDLGNVRMVHHRQRLALGLEPRDDALGVHAQLDDLQRHPTAHRLFLFGHINDAATAFTDLLQDFIMPDLRPRLFLFTPLRQIARRRRGFGIVRGRSQRGDALGKQLFGVVVDRE